MKQMFEALEKQSLDAMWITSAANVRYLTQFSAPRDASVLVSNGEILLITDARYGLQAQQEYQGPAFIWNQPQDGYGHLERLLQGKRVGFERQHLTVNVYELISGWTSVHWQGTSNLVERLRMHKTPYEIEQIQKAQSIADGALSHVLPKLVPGVRECDIALQLEVEMRSRGASGPAFEITVASGKRSALPHGTASTKVIEEGDWVTIDMGAVVEGYHSDMTRSYPIGNASSQLLDRYRAVREAKLAVLSQIKAGVGCADMDRLARDILAEKGYANEFIHSLGHGVGLEIHEEPKLSFRAHPEDRFEVGMVVTVEPGLYVPDLGGIRLEDLIVVTETGCEVLSQAEELDL
ncbi:MAG: Xaa-Pro peptidase family protein [Deinococcaceae bacterium]